MVYIEALILLPIALFVLYKWSTAKYHILIERGVPHDKPKPLIGNLEWKVLLGRVPMIRIMIDSYLRYKGSKLYGVYNLRVPSIMIIDVELIKKIAIKDFDNFTNHQTVFENAEGNYLAKGLISLKDHKWREMRNTLTPSFTGSKMRLMFELINECCQEGVKYIENEIESVGKNELDLDMKEYFNRFAIDVIASAAFGVKINSFEDKTNKFFTIGTDLIKIKKVALLKMSLFRIMPKVMKALGIKFMDEEQIIYFKSMVFDAIKYRQKHNIIRPDMIQLLMEARRHFEESKSAETSGHVEFNDEDLLAQCLLFFFAGFATVASCLCFTTYELAMKPTVQQRLYEEVLETEQKLEGKPLDYDALLSMKYMDMVLSESLRKWPPAIATDRICSKDYKLFDDDGSLLADLKKGDQLILPIVGYQRDAEYFANPDEFEPERFSDERKSEIKPFTYMPFGVGPRNCIGSRFALMETKSIIYHMLLKFKLMPTKKTPEDMMKSLKIMEIEPKDGFWLKFEPRED